MLHLEKLNMSHRSRARKKTLKTRFMLWMDFLVKTLHSTKIITTTTPIHRKLKQRANHSEIHKVREWGENLSEECKKENTFRILRTVVFHHSGKLIWKILVLILQALDHHPFRHFKQNLDLQSIWSSPDLHGELIHACQIKWSLLLLVLAGVDLHSCIGDKLDLIGGWLGGGPCDYCVSPSPKNWVLGIFSLGQD